MDEVIDTAKLSAALKNRHTGDEWAYFQELRTATGHFARGGYIDAYAVGLWNKNRSFIAYEIKQSRGDFKSDIANFEIKQETAIRNSTQFYYVCPNGLIAAEEVPEISGLMWVNSGGTRVQKVAPLREIKNGIDLDFARALMRASAGKNLVKSSLWKYVGEEITEEKIMVLAKEQGHIYNERQIKSEAERMSRDERERAWSILKMFAEMAHFQYDLKSGEAEVIAKSLFESYKKRQNLTAAASNMQYHVKEMRKLMDRLEIEAKSLSESDHENNR